MCVCQKSLKGSKTQLVKLGSEKKKKEKNLKNFKQELRPAGGNRGCFETLVVINVKVDLNF